MTGGGKGARGEFARGGLVLFACFLGIGVSTVSLMGYSAGVFIAPLSRDFGWSRAEIGASAAISNAVLLVAAPLAGRLIDRCGLRSIATASLVLYAACVAALSQMQGELWVFYALCAAMTFVGVASTPLAFTRAIGAFFHHRRGLALGLALTSTGVAGVLAPSLLTPYVAHHGWRAGYFVLAVVVWVAAPVVFLLVRDGPKAADGARASAAASGARWGEAWRSPAFMTMAAIFVLAALAVNGIVVSFVPLSMEAGDSAAEAGALAALVGAAVVVGRLVTGLLIDHVFAPYVAAAVFGFAAACLLAFWGLGQPVAPLAAVGLGLALGAEVDLIGYLTSRYFGLANYGVIFGAQYSLFLFGAGLSPIAAGAIYDTTGGYAPAILGAAILLALAALAALRLPKFPEGPR